MRTLAKTTTYWMCHITVASLLAWWLTGQVEAAIAIGLLEPTVQAGVFFVHERIWERHRTVPQSVDGGHQAV